MVKTTKQYRLKFQESIKYWCFKIFLQHSAFSTTFFLSSQQSDVFLAHKKKTNKSVELFYLLPTSSKKKYRISVLSSAL